MSNKLHNEYRDEDSLLYTKHAMQIALRINKGIEDAGISKTEFAKRVGKSTPEVSKWLSGNQNFTLRTLSKIENALGIEIVRFFSREQLGLNAKPIQRNLKLVVAHDARSGEVQSIGDLDVA